MNNIKFRNVIEKSFKLVVLLTVSLCLSSCDVTSEESKIDCWKCEEMIPTNVNYCSYCGAYQGFSEEDTVSVDNDFESDYYEDENDEYYNELNCDICYSSGCTNVVNSYGEYCSEHECADRNCSNEKNFSSNYCYLHGCTTLSCENKRSGLSFYCSEHKCLKDGCSAQKSVMSNYCLLHE